MSGNQPDWKTLATVYNSILDLRKDVEDLSKQTEGDEWVLALDNVLQSARRIVWGQVQEWEKKP